MNWNHGKLKTKQQKLTRNRNIILSIRHGTLEKRFGRCTHDDKGIEPDERAIPWWNGWEVGVRGSRQSQEKRVERKQCENSYAMAGRNEYKTRWQ